MRSDTGSTFYVSRSPAVISNSGLPHENPGLSHWATDTVLHSLTHSLTQSDKPDDIVSYGLASKHNKHKNCILKMSA